VLDTKSPKYLEMAQGHISLLVTSEQEREERLPSLLCRSGPKDYCWGVVLNCYELRTRQHKKWVKG
jgi:hypothetical protein